MSSDSLEGVAKLGAAILFALGLLLALLSGLATCFPSSTYRVCLNSLCVYTVPAGLAIAGLVLGGLSIFASTAIWRLRKWGGELGICLSTAITFYSIFWSPRIEAPGALPGGEAIWVSAVASAACIVIGWRALR